MLSSAAELRWSSDLVENRVGLEQVGVGRIRDSSTFAAGQRSEIGRYEVPTEVSLPGFGIGMINQDFHIAGI